MDNPNNFVYIVHAKEEEKRCKIGYWTSTLKSLRSRYATSYGGDLKLYSYDSLHPILSETAFKLRYQDYHIINEIYHIKYIDEYKEFFDKLSTKTDTDLNDYIVHLYSDNMLNFEDVISDTILKCASCDYETDKVYLYNQHINRKVLCKKIVENTNTISDKIYNCPRCNYETDNSFLFVQHLERKTLCKAVNGDISLNELKTKYINPKIITCNICNMGFKTKNGLTKHKKICTINTNSIITNDNSIMAIENLKNEINQLRQLFLNNNNVI
jgi:hypothetical protein